MPSEAGSDMQDLRFVKLKDKPDYKEPTTTQ